MANSFFDEKDVEPSGSFFDSGDLHPEDQAPQAKPDIGVGRAALAGLGSGFTFGTSEEITAPFAAAAAMATENLPNTSPEETTYEKYKRLMQTYRDTAREEQKTAQEQHPYAYTGGALAGAIPQMAIMPSMGGAAVTEALAPKIGTSLAKIAGGVTEGAAQGALTGAGEAEGNLSDRASGAIVGGELGAAIGGTIPVAGALLSGAKEAGKLINKIPFVRRTTEALERGTRGQALIGQETQKAASNAVSKTSNEFFDKILDAREQIGTQITDKIKAATESGKEVDLSDVIPEIRTKLKEITSSPGSSEAQSWAAGIESELDRFFPREKPIVENTYLGVDKADLPEGMITPAPTPPKPVSYKLTPEKARELKQTIFKFTPTANEGKLLPTQGRAAGIAQDIYSQADTKLTEAVPGIADKVVSGEVSPGLNSQYTQIMEALELTGVKREALPEQVQNQVKKFFEKLKNEGSTGDTVQLFMDGIIKRLKDIAPDVAKKYEAELADTVGRLKSSIDVNKGFDRIGVIATPVSMMKGGANVVGLGINKLSKIPGASAAGSKIANAAEKVGKAATSIPTSKALGTAAGVAGGASANSQKKPYEIHKEYAKIAENSSPEDLVAKAQELRTQYGDKANQIATILENMSKAKPETRRALMFTVLQNPAYKQMLGLNKENE